MAAEEVTGYDHDELRDLKAEYETTPKHVDDEIEFETAYCLTRIGKQPDDYDGPTRHCAQRVSRISGGGHAPNCRFHGGNTTGETDNLELLAAMTHGMYATDDHLQDEFTDADQDLYDFIMSWADAYGWPAKEEDPARYDVLEQLAISRVRVARSEKYILDEGEKRVEEIYDENGNPRTIEDPHTLSEDIRLKRKLVLDMMKELGLTPKERSRMDMQESEASAMDQLADLASDAVFSGDSGEFDPDDPVFEDNDG